jgi:hypothetical protein
MRVSGIAHRICLELNPLTVFMEGSSSQEANSCSAAMQIARLRWKAKVLYFALEPYSEIHFNIISPHLRLRPLGSPSPS